MAASSAPTVVDTDLVSSRHIADASVVVGSEFRIGPDAARAGSALMGRYSLAELRPGLVVHTSDAVELHDLTSEITQRPGLTCSIVLKGAVDFLLDDRPFALRSGPDDTPHGQLIYRAEPVRFVRHARRGMHLCKVNITVSPEWLAGCPGSGNLLPDCLDHHLAEASWTPSAHAVQLAHQLLNPPSVDGLVGRLYMESRATSLLLEAFARLADVTPRPSVPDRDRRRVEDACRLLAGQAPDGVRLEDVARSVGASVSTLQRLFHAVHGTSIYGVVRERRLVEARLALEGGGVTITQAAERAGYKSAANFATAFKRQFGVTPSDVARRART
ncbi:AraC family transcriptional regulator [Acuticoccus sp. I52.16.1]|uniref:helix-turn-helix transcriptional regulator n=1 Tax=Acuticoccus sp. I52.16.1 TaxID=2928472 RepID=UPI001FD3AA10|nr:AraC family transcriptional regulator [Acuticoccus sp. I52.16.1]UOM35634.1 AraC family transcriptional regulator [Acuticoccus sp. I52.16.1]